MLTIVNKYPKFSFLCLGFLFGLSIGLGQAYWGQQTIEEYKEIAREERSRYELALQTKSQTITELSNEITRLKSSERKVLIKNADGSSKEVFEKTIDQGSESSTESNSKVVEAISKEIRDIEKKHTEIDKTVTTKKLNIWIGVTPKYNYIIGVDYPIWGTVTAHGSIAIEGLSVGGALGVGILF